MKQLSPIQDLKNIYPNLEYLNGELFNAEELIDSDANELIEDHYDGDECYIGDGSNNPENDVLASLCGKDYIEARFDSDYDEAFQNI